MSVGYCNIINKSKNGGVLKSLKLIKLQMRKV